VAVRVPPPVGLKLRLIVQVFPAAIAGTQLLGAEKSAASAPLTVMVLTVMVDVPLFVTTTGTAFDAMPIVAVPNDALDGAIERLGAMPLPESCTICGLAGALSEMLRLAAYGPAAAGENETLNVHDAPAASVAPDATHPPPLVPVKENADAPEPESDAPPMVSFAVPLFVIVTISAAPVVPTPCDVNVSAVGAMAAAGAPAPPVPEYATTIDSGCCDVPV
jgi:hypothetical protein